MDSFRSYGEHLKINLRQLGFTTLSPTPNFPLVRHLPKTAISAERTLQPLRLYFDNADDDDISYSSVSAPQQLTCAIFLPRHKS